MQASIGKPDFKQFIPAIIWFLLVLILLCLPADDIPAVDDWFTRLYVDKWIHAFLFAIMGLLFMKPFKNTYYSLRRKRIIFIYIGLFLSLWGLTTEWIQMHFISGRSFETSDWMADTSGAFISLLIALKSFR